MESRLEHIIGDVSYIIDALRAYADIVNSGCCNECDKQRDCEYAPKVGQLVRYNCPFFVPDKWYRQRMEHSS